MKNSFNEHQDIFPSIKVIFLAPTFFNIPLSIAYWISPSDKITPYPNNILISVFLRLPKSFLIGLTSVIWLTSASSTFSLAFTLRLNLIQGISSINSPPVDFLAPGTIEPITSYWWLRITKCIGWLYISLVIYLQNILADFANAPTFSCFKSEISEPFSNFLDIVSRFSSMVSSSDLERVAPRLSQRKK